MSNIAQVINKYASELRQAINSQVSPSVSFEAQAEELLKRDKGSLVRLGKSFSVNANSDDSPDYLHIKFNPLLAEILMRDGSLLVDRCVQELRDYHELRAKSFETHVQVDELLRLNDIAVQEENDAYDLPEKIDELSAHSSEKERDTLKSVSDQLGSAINENKGRRDEIVKKTLAAAWAVNDDAAHATKVGNDDLKIDFTFPRDHARFAAQISAEYAFTMEEKALRGQKALQSGNSEAAEFRRQATETSKTYRKLSADFQRLRNDVARFVALRRALALTRTDGELNYGEQAASSFARFENTLNAALLRLDTAAEGLEKLYKYPRNLFPRTSEKVPVNFDEVVAWCQKTNLWLAAFQDMQQVVTRSFSLRHLLGNDKFEAGRKVLKWNFPLTPNHFSDRYLVRLRTLAVQIQTDEEPGSWNVAIAPPKHGQIQYPKGDPTPITQDQVGRLFLGRVTERKFAVAPEGVNPPQIFNVSPISDPATKDEWEVEILGSTSNAQPHDLKDIDIHMTVALL